jgi:hypothetical protein
MPAICNVLYDVTPMLGALRYVRMLRLVLVNDDRFRWVS